MSPIVTALWILGLVLAGLVVLAATPPVAPRGSQRD